MNLLIASSIDPETIEKLREKHDVICAFRAPQEELQRLIKDRDVLIFRSGVDISSDVMHCSPELKALIRAGSGIDNIDLEYVHQHGLKFYRIPEPGARAVAEMTFAHFLALSRNLLQADRLWRQGRWAKHQLSGFLLTGKTLGIIGVGNIGTRVGQLGSAWGMKVLGYDIQGSSARAAELWDKYRIRLTDFNQVLANADYISLHVPLDDSTRYMFDKDVFSRIKRGAFLVNMARGGVVDEQALYRALTDDQILRGAALDVHEAEGEGHISPLADLPNVILSPHIGSQTIDSQREIGERILTIVEALTCEGNNVQNKEPGKVTERIIS